MKILGCLRIVDSQIEQSYRDVRFSRTRTEDLPINAINASRSQCSGQQNKFPLARYCGSDIKINPKFSKRVIFSDKCKHFAISLFQQAKLSGMGFETSN